MVFFFIGDELCLVGELFDVGCVYDFNCYILYGMFMCFGCDVLDMGVVLDDLVVLEVVFCSVCEEVDVVIILGGVFVGVVDYIK